MTRREEYGEGKEWLTHATLSVQWGGDKRDGGEKTVCMAASGTGYMVITGDVTVLSAQILRTALYMA